MQATHNEHAPATSRAAAMGRPVKIALLSASEKCRIPAADGGAPSACIRETEMELRHE